MQYLPGTCPHAAAGSARGISPLRDIYAHRGIRYCALPEGAVTAEPVLGNARAVLACRGYDPPPEAAGWRFSGAPSPSLT